MLVLFILLVIIGTARW
ncbi:MAG: YjcZ family sporulation protein [Bacilli bacterium]|nr:YjcZ family sporulation protein [Bacilli bacterium]